MLYDDGYKMIMTEGIMSLLHHPSAPIVECSKAAKVLHNLEHHYPLVLNLKMPI